jgi:hypothetical protein
VIKLPSRILDGECARCGGKIVKRWVSESDNRYYEDDESGFGPNGDLCFSCALAIESFERSKKVEEYDKTHGYR